MIAESTGRPERWAEALSELRAALIEEIGVTPGGSLVYGRPHESTRAFSRPRYSAAGERVIGWVTFAPDCDRSDGAACGHPPDGSWRPIRASPPADLVARHLEAEDGGWRINAYERGADGLWRCRWPYRRAMDRLANRNVRQAVVLWRLLRREPLGQAWRGLRAPVDPRAETVALAHTVLRWADEEMCAEYERRPRLFGRSSPGWVDKSESQQRAEGGVA